MPRTRLAAVPFVVAEAIPMLAALAAAGVLATTLILVLLAIAGAPADLAPTRWMSLGHV